MGQTSSRVKVVAKVAVPEGSCRVDTMTLSYSRITCCGRGKRRLARFTFSEHAWVCSGGLRVCSSKEGQRLHLAALLRKDGDTAVRVKCTYRRVLVYEDSLPLARLLVLLEGAVEKGGTAGLFFQFASSNGWRCGEEVAADEPSEDTAAAAGDEPSEAAAADEPIEDAVTDEHDEDAAAAEPSEDAEGKGMLSNEDAVVPAFHVRVPSFTDLAAATVPEVDLGDLSTLAFYKDLINGKVPEVDVKVPASPPQAPETVPEIDLGDPSSLALWKYLHMSVPETDSVVPSPSVQAFETAAEEDPSEPTETIQAAETTEGRSTWMNALLDGVAVLNVVVACVLLLYEFW